MSALEELLSKRYRDDVTDASTTPEQLPQNEISPDETIADAASLTVSDQTKQTNETNEVDLKVDLAGSVATADKGTICDEAGETASPGQVAEETNTTPDVTENDSVDSDSVDSDSVDSDSSDSVIIDSNEDTLPERTAFQPEWEVDRFLWPTICEQVEDRLGDELRNTIEMIKLDCLQRNRNVVGLTNSDHNAGSSTMTLCLAREAARQGHSVAVIDLNHCRPALMDQLGVACEQGLESLQMASVAPQNICVTAVDDGVSLLPMLRPVDAEYCASQTIYELIETMSTTHDLVILDASFEALQQMSADNEFQGFGLIVVSKNPKDHESVDVARQLCSKTIWALGTIHNFAA